MDAVLGLCTEILEHTSADEVAVCNLASVSGDGDYDLQELYRVLKAATPNLNKVIDRNYFAVEGARRSNLRHRPIGLGVQALHWCTTHALHWPYCLHRWIRLLWRQVPLVAALTKIPGGDFVCAASVDRT